MSTAKTIKFDVLVLGECVFQPGTCPRCVKLHITFKGKHSCLQKKDIVAFLTVMDKQAAVYYSFPLFIMEGTIIPFC